MTDTNDDTHTDESHETTDSSSDGDGFDLDQINDPEIKEKVKAEREKQASTDGGEAEADDASDETPVRVDDSEDVAERDVDAEHNPALHGPKDGQTETTVSPTNEDPTDIDIDKFDFEDQDFDEAFGQSKEDVIITFKSIKFLLSAPEDEEAMNLFETMQETEDAKERFRAVFDAVIEKPVVTDDLVGKMDFMEMAALAGRCLEHVGMDDFEDFSEESV